MNIGIAENNRKKVADELSKLLANEYLLFTKTKNAHWNVEGLDFYEKHQLFDNQANQLAFTIDSVAERIRTLGFVVPASLKAFLALTSLQETALVTNNSTEFIKDLLSAHEIIIIQLRSNINVFADSYNDFGSSDFITGLLQEHEKTAWILRTLLK
ncbi:Dps family protein [Cellulophaga sp. BC115SP]|uniref:Dps family protein n=1 Tax=Cellulophaga sp. BC115SP TaxID=2683263 RepID=UPI0014126221|nr:DNA starvation/stationary phase protection protein [Cellulophaga sp. BC115SP]NBB27530.1 DNA starvation/stationary phase protection protein [Cellulophaga sp. BC115SP]